ncbi:MAG TPA: histidine phosphatase family protein [Nocardioidaceae bacterium]|nr:histidine phosphatase family protein [Nocardioidaceae bacterium]
MSALFLVRHGRSDVRREHAAQDWGIDPDGYVDIAALADSGRLPATATWFSSPEPKAITTARLLHPGTLRVVPGLAEQRRGTHWFEQPDDLEDAVRRAFENPEQSAAPGWEPISRTRNRLLPAVHRILDEATGEVVLVGHGTAWSLVAADLTGQPPDLDAWGRLETPDVWRLDLP